MDRNKIAMVAAQRYFLPCAAETDWKGERNEQTQQAGGLGMLEHEKGLKGINHIRRSWGSLGSQACQWIKTAGTARREEGGPKLKLTPHTTGVSYHTTFLWFWAQNSGPQNADLFTDLSQSHSLLEKMRAVASKLAVVFLPFSSLPETEPMPLCILHRHSPNLATSPGLWIPLTDTILH